jgi:hypothetical protein
MYQMDIERNRFLLCNFAKIRIFKIQRQKEYILSHPEVVDRLSDHEKHFLTKLQMLDDQHVTELITNRFSSDEHKEYFQSTVAKLNFSNPKFDVSFVFNSFFLYIYTHSFVYSSTSPSSSARLWLLSAIS